MGQLTRQQVHGVKKLLSERYPELLGHIYDVNEPAKWKKEIDEDNVVKIHKGLKNKPTPPKPPTASRARGTPYMPPPEVEGAAVVEPDDDDDDEEEDDAVPIVKQPVRGRKRRIVSA